VQPDPAAEQERDLVGLRDQDQPAGPRVDDVVDPLAKRGARRDRVQGPELSGVETRLEFVKLIPGLRHHRASMMAKAAARRTPPNPVWSARIAACQVRATSGGVPKLGSPAGDEADRGA